MIPKAQIEMLLEKLAKMPALAARGYRKGTAQRDSDLLAAMEALSGGRLKATGQQIGNAMGSRGLSQNIGLLPNYAGFAVGRHPGLAGGLAGGGGVAALAALLGGDGELDDDVPWAGQSMDDDVAAFLKGQGFPGGKAGMPYEEAIQHGLLSAEDLRKLW